LLLSPGIVRYVLTDDDLAVWVARLDDLFALVPGGSGGRSRDGGRVRTSAAY
jgi:hypothetical protein